MDRSVHTPEDWNVAVALSLCVPTVFPPTGVGMCSGLYSKKVLKFNLSSDYCMYGGPLKMSVSVLLPVLLDSDGSREVFLVDMSSMSVFDLSGNLASDDNSGKVLAGIMDQHEASMPNIPHEQIYEVMKTERKLSKDNEKHIFRRGH